MEGKVTNMIMKKEKDEGEEGDEDEVEYNVYIQRIRTECHGEVAR